MTHTLLADRLAKADRRRIFWPRLLDRLATCCECAFYGILIAVGHVLLIRWLMGG